MSGLSFVLFCCSGICFANYLAKGKIIKVSSTNNFKTVSTGVRG